MHVTASGRSLISRQSPGELGGVSRPTSEWCISALSVRVNPSSQSAQITASCLRLLNHPSFNHHVTNSACSPAALVRHFAGAGLSPRLPLWAQPISLCGVCVSLGHNERLIRGEDEPREELELDKQEGRTGIWCEMMGGRESEIMESIEAEAIKMKDTVTASEKNLCWNYVWRCLRHNFNENYKSIIKVFVLLSIFS